MHAVTLQPGTSTNKQVAILLLTCAGLLMQTVAHGNSDQAVILPIGQFSAAKLDGWKIKPFSGTTQYRIQHDSTGAYLQATSEDAASALYYKQSVDVERTPYLNWRWRIDQPLPALPERDKAGDDYAARVYVIIRTGKLPWDVHALNYVWSSTQKPASVWPNAFTRRAIMIALRSSQTDDSSRWISEKIDLRADIKKYLGISNGRIIGVAIMTDTDNAHAETQASYGDIYFSSR